MIIAGLAPPRPLLVRLDVSRYIELCWSPAMLAEGYGRVNLEAALPALPLGDGRSRLIHETF